MDLWRVKPPCRIGFLVDDCRIILFAGGGTGGHLFPGIAVAQALARQSSTLKPLFLCTERPIDRTILGPTGFEFIPQPIVPPTRSIGGLLKFWRSWRETRDLVKTTLDRRKPVAAVGLGGYAAGIAIKRAARRLPTVILNPDVIPGKANRYLLPDVRLICCQFEQTAEHVPPQHRDKLRVTGCPIRADLYPLPSRAEAAGRLGLDASLLTLVITGASQGAKTVNEAVLEALQGVRLQGWQVLHLAGTDHAASVRQEYRELNIEARVIDFTDQMRDIWAVADLCISRSGASTCAELTAAGVPAILMPYPFHADLHQRANARVLADAGAAVLVDDQKDRRRNAAILRPVLERLLYDATARREMSDRSRALGRTDAADRVAEELIRLLA
ncbi:MAG: UDP-N-acetylglucosamine--N-acetylmuramyl-(pentapeptide) pyrophosphoryl-undecaprenol N-acetylglucosamine transferase [Phycisphaerae bacterium]|nr:UDP-N-acetylglucosamine--N-acetylmuramyl-(pentapeptide) pyrophosphoryl-undecaprenol N-acetylglucosamine transferase [Phycisphaerae bacterium]MDW8262772.1 UDP-N-acetylglucosamine--N-acetylmuramyl-(pentapeptide) pyrophosphoryl-undecaprenol N-acetylglucosamine transferase [Phycisphaerales bacterium]